LGAYELSVHGRSTHPAFRFFRRFADLVEAAKGPRGAEYAPFVRIVERYEDLIPEKCAAIRDGVGGDEAVRISTVHKAKGLEAPHVRLAGDFAPFCVYDKKRRLVFRPEEANVHYVAITRAQQLLEIGGGFAAIYQSSLANGNYLRGFAPPAAIATVVAEARGLR
jgi:ATP-dependent exoDNAse (exonuclease V) beta subunit